MNQMTGRDLIVFILQHKLEDKPIFENGRLLGFKTVEETALKLGTGVATVRAWAERGMLYSVCINDVIYIADELYEVEDKHDE